MTMMECFADALSYPDERMPVLLGDLLAAAAAESPDAAEAVQRFIAGTADLPVRSLRELYTRTFDLMAVCSPYAGIHLFGEDNYKRGGLMARLKEAFTANGFDAGNELPDHCAVLLRYSCAAPAEEAQEVRDLLLRGPVDSMLAILNKTQNPYTHLLTALGTALGSSREELQAVPDGREGA